MNHPLQMGKALKSRAFHHSQKIDDTCGKWLNGRDVTRYFTTWTGGWLSYGSWLAAPREPRFFRGNRMLFREVPGKGKRIQASLTSETSYYGHSITPFLLDDDCGLKSEYILGVVNSRLMSWMGLLTLPNFGKDIFPKLNPLDIKQLPIRPINFDEPIEAEKHDRMVQLVNRILEHHQKKADEKNPESLRHLETQISIIDRQIDKLVYDLYDLTDEDIVLVESSV